MDLHGQHAVISGGLGDIGCGIARAFVEAGATVSLSDLHDPERAEAALDSLAQMGGKIDYRQIDVRDADAVAGWLDTQPQAADIIVPNAAIVRRSSLLELAPDQWRDELRVDLDGAFHVAQAAARRLVAERKQGRIVFIGSWAADHVHAALPAYSVAKAGLRMLMRCLALELAPHGILVNEVAPGWVDAGLSAQLMAQRPELRRANAEIVPTGALLSTADVARAVLACCDPAQQQLTGQSLVLDGALSLLNAASPTRGPKA